MNFISPPLDWPDLLGFLIIILPIVIVIYLEFLFSFISKLELPGCIAFFSAFLFLGSGGIGSSVMYFYSRYEGQPASLELVWSAIDYSYGLFFIFFLAFIPVIFTFYKSASYLYNHPIESKFVQTLVFALPSIPSMALAYWILGSTWFGSQLFGTPLNLKQLLSDESFSLLNDYSPLRFTIIASRLTTALIAVGIVALVTLINNVLGILSRLKGHKEGGESKRKGRLPSRKNRYKDKFDLEISDESYLSVEEEGEEFQELPLPARNSMRPTPITEEHNLRPVDETDDNTLHEKKEE